MNIICLLTVSVMLHGKAMDHYWMEEKWVKGVVISKDEEVYIADFSKEAKEKGYTGDYGERLVQKIMCRELK